LVLFEKDPASLKDTIGEMVYSMDVEDQVHRARNTVFDKEADEDVLQRSKPRKLTGLDLAEARLAEGDTATAASMARQVLAGQSDTVASVAEEARANFILARVEAMNGHPEQAIEDFQKTLTTSKEARLVSWSHIYLGRMLDLDCKRDQAVGEYKLALENRDGQQDTRLAAERGLKAAYAVKGHSCEEDDSADEPPAQPATPGGQGKAQNSKP
jgi:tetratricopeptide (TPR) repeat protein